ncbi:unnamed protein product [Merluccius merluccius]
MLLPTPSVYPRAEPVKSSELRFQATREQVLPWMDSRALCFWAFDMGVLVRCEFWRDKGFLLGNVYLACGGNYILMLWLGLVQPVHNLSNDRAGAAERTSASQRATKGDHRLHCD